MKKWLMVGVMLCMVLITGCSEKAKTVMDLEQVSLKQMDKKISSKTTMVVYYGWIENCTDSKNFQQNYLDKKINDNKAFRDLLVVNLDQEMPKALAKRELREPLFQKYQVMFSPTLVYYVDGKLQTKLEWTPDTTDKKTGIMKSQLDDFFKECGYIK